MSFPSYTATDWRDAPLDLTTPINRSSLRAMESQIASYALSLNKLLPVARTLTSTSLTMLSSDLGQAVRMQNLVPRDFEIPSAASLPGIAVGSFFQIAAQEDPVTITHELGGGHLTSTLDLTTVASGGLALCWKHEAPDEWWLVGTLQ